MNKVHLLKDMQTSLIYCIPDNVADKFKLPENRPSSVFRNLDDQNSILTDLKTGVFFRVPEKILQLYSIMDRELGNYFESGKITGINKPQKADRKYRSSLSGIYSNSTWVSINLGGTCNSHCQFCYTEWTRPNGNLSTSEIFIALNQIKKTKPQLDSIVITGGEPTLRKDLVIIIERIKSLGFGTITLQTNGQSLGNLQYLNSLMSTGITDFMISLHGPTATIHDKITRDKGGFQKVILALKNIAKVRITSTINTVICRENHNQIGKIVQLIDSIFSGNVKIRFSYPIIEGAAFDNLANVCVSFSDVESELTVATNLAKAKGYEIQIFGMPECISRKYSSYKVNTMATNSQLLSVSVFNRDNVPRGEEYLKLNSCQKCTEVQNCEGVQIDYLRVFPESFSEFKPIEPPNRA